MICVADQDIITLEQLDELCRALIEDIQADIDVDDERAALQVRDDGKTTTQRAVEALQREERFHGEHAVAKAWLRTNEPHVRIFWRSNE